MADTQYVAPFGTTSSPASWVLPAALEIAPKTAYASYNGGASVAAWKPCLRLISDSGHVVAEAVASTSVAAGGSADVTWFQGLSPPCPPPSTYYPNTNNNDAVLAFGPWAYWKLNEAAGAGSVADSSGHGRTLTPAGAGATLGNSGIVPTSADTSGYLAGNGGSATFGWATSVAQLWTPQVATVVMWLQSPGRASFSQSLFSLGSYTSATTRLFNCILNTSGQPQWQYQDVTGTLQTNTFAVGVADRNRHMIAFVQDGTNVTMYLDGAQAAQQPQAAALKASTSFGPAIGQPTGSSGDRSAVGYFEHVAFFDKVLTGANILSLYQAGTVLPS